jgi:hypothetical protein
MANWVRDFLITHPDYNVLTVAKRAKHSMHFQRSGYVEANFTGAPMHYLDAVTGWQPLDTALLLDTVRQEYGAPGLATRIKLDGSVRIADLAAIGTTLYGQKTSRVGVLNISTRKFTVTKTLPMGAVDGENIIRETGIYRHVLCNSETGLRETLTLLQAPASGAANEWFVLETVITGASYPDGWLDTELTQAGFRFPLPTAADANGTVAPIRHYARTVGGVQYLYTGIALSWLATAVYPVVLDPDYLDDTNDGEIDGSATSYATARSTATAVAVALTNSRIGQKRASAIRECYRTFLKFITSPIGAGSTVTQVNIQITAHSDLSTVDFDVNIIKNDWSVNDPITSDNRETPYDACLSSAEDTSIWRNTANGAPPNGFVIDTQYVSGNLSTAWVDVDGNTYYSLVSNRDYDSAGTEPTGNEYISIHTQEDTTESYRPILTIDYTAAAGGAKLSTTRMMTGVGR